MADSMIPPVRPDAVSEDPEARDINKFKQALNVFMYGSRDPSHVDVGERRAAGVFQHNIGKGMAISAGARPEVAGHIMAAYANQGAQAAQAMRERYYEKEFRQMMQVQINPLKEEFDAAAASAKERLQVIHAPIPRAVSFEEGKQRAVGAQLLTPAAPEAVQTGTTAEGKPKTKIVEGVAPPEPNPAAGPQVMGATEYTAEQMAFTDPVTGQPVPIASPRGQAIEREVMNDLMDQHNKLLTNMMDSFAQYPGNPFAVGAMQKIFDGVINQAGKAVTGRADPREQITWWQEYNEKQADIAKKTTEANQALLDLEVGEANINAKAADAVQQASQNSEFADLLGKKAKDYIKKGIPVEEWDPKTKREAAALAASQRELQLKDLQARKQAGMVRVEPKELHLPDTWHSRFQTRDEGYRHKLAQRYAQMNNDLIGDLTAISSMNADEQERAMDALGVPSGIRSLVKLGALTEDEVATWMETKLVGSQEYKNAQTKTYMDTIAEVTRQQPEVFGSIETDNEQFIQAWAQQKREKGMSDAEIQEKVDYMRADTLGTHILSTTGENPPDTYRPPAFQMKIQDEYIGPRQVAPAAPAALDEARSDMYNQSQLPSRTKELYSEVTQPQEVSVTVEQVLGGDPSTMTQSQIEKSVELVERERDKLIPDNLTTAQYTVKLSSLTKKERQLYRELTARAEALKSHLPREESWFEKASESMGLAAKGFLIEREENAERREKARLASERRTEDLLRAIPKVN